MQMVEKVRTKAKLTTDLTQLEQKNYQTALRAAQEGIVLLQNNGVLPLVSDSSVALFGSGVTHTVKCGSGSGECNTRNEVTIYEGMRKLGFHITTEKILETYAKQAELHKKEYFAAQQKKAGVLNFSVTMSSMAQPYRTPAFPALTKADMDNQADTCIYVISRISGESYDRELKPGDYYPDEQEQTNIRLCAQHYKHMILVINAGGMVDIGCLDDLKLDAVLFMCMLGKAGGEALATVLSGEVCPSGHLTDTWSMDYKDIPFGMEYSYLNGDLEKDYFKENIYVGYRYFDTFGKTPRYPFGFGLSYTTFALHTEAYLEGNEIHVAANVKNTGSCAGKEVVQIYASCPDGVLDKEYQRLVAFAKTELLQPGQEQKLTLQISLQELASYSEEKAAWLLDAGNYILRAGNSSRNTTAFATVSVTEMLLLSRHKNLCVCKNPFEQLKKDIAAPEAADGLPVLTVTADMANTVTHTYEDPTEYHDDQVDALMAKLTVQEMADIVVGCGNDMIMPTKHHNTVPGATGYTTNKYFDRGIYDMAMCDGPAGIRFQREAVAVKGKNLVKGITSSIELLNFLPSLIRKMAFGKPEDGTLLYQYITAFPVGTSMAQTWNTELVEAVGRAANSELEEYGITMWLAPGMNIHRNPLCGRNYEYYSEDPLLTGKIAAAMTRGAQSSGNHSVTLKHFFCNSQESNRGAVSSEVSERAIREIYLKGFEIAVKEGSAAGVMTSYNRVNGTFSAVNHDAVTKILRNEWGFDGIVITDWDSWKKDCDADVSMYAGVDLLMQGDEKQKKQIRKALKQGTLDEKYVRRAASHVLRLISRVNWEA